MKKLVSFLFVAVCVMYVHAALEFGYLEINAPEHTSISVYCHSLRCGFGSLLSTGDTIYVGDTIHIVFQTDDGYAYFEDGKKETNHGEDVKILAEDINLADTIFRINGPMASLLPPQISLSPDGNGVHATFKSAVSNSFKTFITQTPLATTDNPDYQKGIRTVSSEGCTFANLVDGTTYYLYALAVDDTINTWTYKSFVYRSNTDPCTMTITMQDEYGDTWNDNALMIIDNGINTFFTLNEKTNEKVTTTYTSHGGEITAIWIKGEYPDEVSFQVTDAYGTVLYEMETGDGETINTGDTLFSFTLCPAACDATIKNLKYTLGETISDTQEYNISWTCEETTTFDIAITQEPNPTIEQLESIATRVNSNTYTLQGNLYGTYKIYVRPIGSNNEKGAWQTTAWLDWMMKEINDFQVVMILNDIGLPINLDYHYTGSLNEKATLVKGMLGSIYQVTIQEDSAFIAVSGTPQRQYSSIAKNLQWSVIKNFKSPIEPYDTDGTIFKLYKGVNYIFSSFGLDPNVSYNIDIVKLDTALHQLPCKPIQLGSTENGSFENAKSYLLDKYAYGVNGYTFTLTDTTIISINGMLNQWMPRTFMSLFKDSIAFDPKYNIVRSFSFDTRIDTLPAGKYYLLAVMDWQLPSKPDYSIMVKNVSDFQNPPIPVELQNDTVISDVITNKDWIPQLQTYGKIYRYTTTNPSSTDRQFLSLESDNMYISSDVYDSNGKNVCHISNKNITIRTLRDTTPSNTGTRYDIMVTNNNIFEESAFTLTFRSGVNYDTIPVKATVQPGHLYTSALSLKDGLTNHLWPGDFEAYNVRLQKGVNYTIYAHKLTSTQQKVSESPAMAVNVFSPLKKTGTYDGNLAIPFKGYYDGWCVAQFTPDTTLNYTLMFDTQNQFYSLKDSTNYEFFICQTQLFDSLMANAPIVELPYTQTDVSFDPVLKTYWEGAYDFHFSVSTLTSYCSYDAVAYKAVVKPNDTLFAQAGGNADMILYIYNLNSTSKGQSASHRTVINDIPYDFPNESGYFVNNDDHNDTLLIVLSYNDLPMHKVKASLMLSLDSADIQPQYVTVRTNRSSLTLYEDEFTTNNVLDSLTSRISIRATDENNNTVCTLSNNRNDWQVSISGKKATIEFNNTDLPMGYEFSGSSVTVKITLNVVARPTPPDDPSALVNNEETNQPKTYKFFHNGHLFIATPTSIYDLLGNKLSVVQ